MLGFEGGEGFAQAFQLRYPQEASALIAKADKVALHRFDLLGYEDLSFGDEIDWCCEPVGQKRIPLLHWSKISAIDSRRFGDLKVVWELNRHQHLVTLGQAYFLTGEGRYAEEIIAQIVHWSANNPQGRGPNWSSSLEVAFRLISWIWAVRLIQGSPALTEEDRRGITRGIARHAAHVERYLSFYISPNTHLTGEALGLFYAGVFLPRLPQAARWRARASEILLEQLPLHLLSDGGYMERTLWYHLYTVNFYLHFLVLLERSGAAVPEFARQRLSEGLSFLQYAAKPDRAIPMIGDDDGGFFLPLSTAFPWDARGSLALGAAYFGRGDLKALAGETAPEVLWLLGPEGLRRYDRLESTLPTELSRGFPETGYFFMRSGWDENAAYVAFDCGEHGWLNCGHAHADMLGIHATRGETTVVEDPGTCLYVNDAGVRDLFRGPKSHATVLLDGRHPAVPLGNFHWASIPRGRLRHFFAGERHDYAAGEIRLDGGVNMLRELHFIKPDVLVIVDTLLGEGEPLVETRFPLSAGAWALGSEGCWQESGRRRCGVISLGSLAPSLEAGWRSAVYGRKESAPRLVLSGRVRLPFRTAVLVDLAGQGPQGPATITWWGRSFELAYWGRVWIGVGAVPPQSLAGEERVDADCAAGLLERDPEGAVAVVASHGGQRLRWRVTGSPGQGTS